MQKGEKDPVIKIEVAGTDINMRTGTLPDINEPQPMLFIGNFYSAIRYWKQRAERLDKLTAVFIYTESEGKLTLMVNPNDAQADIINGRTHAHPFVKELGLNWTGGKRKTLTKDMLIQLVKMFKPYFVDAGDHAQLVSALTRFNSTSSTVTKDDNSIRGSHEKNHLKVGRIEGLPEVVQLRSPIFYGGEPYLFTAEIGYDVTDASAIFWFDCPDVLALQMEMEEEIKKELQPIIDQGWLLLYE